MWFTSIPKYIWHYRAQNSFYCGIYCKIFIFCTQSLEDLIILPTDVLLFNIIFYPKPCGNELISIVKHYSVIYGSMVDSQITTQCFVLDRLIQPVLGSTKHNEGENDVFKDNSHLFWTLLMELIYKVNLKFIIVIMNLLPVLPALLLYSKFPVYYCKTWHWHW